VISLGWQSCQTRRNHMSTNVWENGVPLGLLDSHVEPIFLS
jgi:hypothetical protein